MILKVINMITIYLATCYCNISHIFDDCMHSTWLCSPQACTNINNNINITNINMVYITNINTNINAVNKRAITVIHYNTKINIPANIIDKIIHKDQFNTQKCV